MDPTAIAALVGFIVGVVAGYLIGIDADGKHQATEGHTPESIVRIQPPMPSVNTVAAVEQPKSLPHRRVGVAEARRRAERESMKPVTHQASITANNTKALETK